MKVKKILALFLVLCLTVSLPVNAAALEQLEDSTAEAGEEFTPADMPDESTAPVDQDQTDPEDTVISDGTSGDESTSPEDKPEEGAPKEDKPEEGAPEEGKPEEGAPKEDKPEEGTPEEDKPEEGAPKEDKPEENPENTLEEDLASILEATVLQGGGTAEDPYRIYSQEDLAAANNYLNAHFSLQNDVNVTYSSWTPIGQDTGFSGVFDGNNHTISGIVVPDNENQYSGLFGRNNGRISNLTVIGDITGKAYTGVLAGYNNGTISNCLTSGSVYSRWGDYSDWGIGGLVGRNNSGKTVSACGSTAEVRGWRSVIGGLIGRNNGSVTNCYAQGNVLRTDTSSGASGGLVGTNDGTLRNCYAAGKVDDGAGGGLSGTTGGRIYNCYYRKANTGNIYGFDVSTGDLSTQSTFYSWDFDHVWEMGENYPVINLRGDDTYASMSGSGTSDDPFLITNERQLYALSVDKALNTSATCYRLANDITITTSYWTPIGVYDAFLGTFDGGGHTISGLKVPENVYEKNGLFGQNNGRIQNLTVAGDVTGKAYTGVLAGYNNGTISNCLTSGSAYSRWGDYSDWGVGGLVGRNNSGKTVSACGSTAEVRGWRSVIGGLIGRNNGSVTNCYAQGNVLRTDTSSGASGGLVGTNDGTLRNCYAAGKVDDGAGGGLSGTTNGKMYNCYHNSINKGNIYGFSVSDEELKIESTFYFWDFDHVWEMRAGYPAINLRGSETTVSFMGDGISDDPYLVKTERQLYAMSVDLATNKSTVYYKLANNITITTNYWTPIGVYDAFLGTFDGGGHTISGLKVIENIYEKNGLFGQNDGRIRNLTVTGDVSGKGCAGVLAGCNNGTISNCLTSGSAYSRWGDYSDWGVGGLVGHNNSGKTVSACGSTAEVRGWRSVIGGLIGRNYGSVTNCYARGNAATTDGSSGHVGGLIGYNNGTLTNCYSTGAVSSPAQNTSGLSGGSGTITSCYYNSSTSGQLDKRGVPTSTENMKLQSTYANWDFSSVWGINSGINDGYPYLQAVVPPTLVPVTGITLDKTSLNLAVGTSENLIASVIPTNASNQSITWSSSDATVATVIRGNVSAVKEGEAVITATTSDGGYTAQCRVTVTPRPTVPVTSVVLNKTSLTLKVGESATLSYTVTPANATNQEATAWISTNTNVADISNGTVTAKQAGTTTITVIVGGKSASCTVMVSGDTIPVTGVTLNKTSTSIEIGKSETLTATVMPSNATNKSVTWSSSNASVATVSNTGTVTANAQGTATITVTTGDGNKTASCTVTVVEPSPQTIPVTGVSLNKDNATIEIGKTETLTATVTPANATNKSVIWTSSNTSVATVSDSGVVTAVTTGTAVIIATTADGDRSDFCIVTVVEPPPKPVAVTGVTLNKSSISIEIGKSETLTATVMPSNATNKSVSWSTSNASVATVSNTGVVTLVAAGTATITVTTADGNKTASCTVTVSPIKVTGISLNATSLTLTEGDSGTLTANVLPGNASNREVIWSSSNPNVAEVSSGGVVTAKTLDRANSATATITATTVDGGFTANCIVIVIKAVQTTVPVTGVKLDQNTLELTVGAMGGSSGVLTATITPANATNQNVTWSSADPSVAAVTDGKVFALKAGTTTVTVTTQDGNKTASCTVTVNPVVSKVTGISLNETDLRLNAGQSTTLTATVTPADASNKAVAWTSSAPAVAEVSENGTVTAKKGGEAVITAITAEGGFTASCTVTVERTMTGITVTKKPDKIVYNYNEELNTAGMEVSAVYDDGSYETVTGWTVRGYSKTASGSQTVTVAYQTYTAVFTVTVGEQPVSGTLPKPQMSVKSVSGGKQVTLTAPQGKIYYTQTLDGDTPVIPTASSQEYTGPIMIPATMTIKAIAIQDSSSSNVTSARISVSQVGTPAIFPGGSTVKDGALVTLRTDTTGADIYYTLDGSDPTPETGTTRKYNGAVLLREEDADANNQLTLKAIAVKDGYANSGTARTTYTMEKTQRPQNEVTVSLGSVSTKAGAVASVPLYLFSDSEVKNFQITAVYDKDAFENYVTVTPAEGIDASKLFLSNDNGILTLLYTGQGVIESGEVCTLNFTSLVSKANTTYPLNAVPEATTVSSGADVDVLLSFMNGVIELGDALKMELDASVSYTKKDGTEITADNINEGNTEEIEASVSINNPVSSSDNTTAGNTPSFGNLYLVIYNRYNQMVSVDTWRVDLSEPSFMFLQTIKIPPNVEVGAIKIMLLSDQMVPLMAANELAK